MFEGSLARERDGGPPAKSEKRRCPSITGAAKVRPSRWLRYGRKVQVKRDTGVLTCSIVKYRERALRGEGEGG